MGPNAFPERRGRGVTTTDSLKGRGPRCGHCGYFVALVSLDPNGKNICEDCSGGKLKGIVEIVKP